jgi:ABC-type branched-subunit amino acid transport system ATPase component
VNESASAPASTPTDAAKKPLKLPDLTIEGFRGFERFHFPKLARVNLLVGPNNSGKTTVLEAVEILADSSIAALGTALVRRREFDAKGRHPDDFRDLDFRQLFRNRDFAREFRIACPSMFYECKVRVAAEPDAFSDVRLGKHWEFEIKEDRQSYSLTAESMGLGTLSREVIRSRGIPLRFVSLDIDPVRLREQWDQIALEPEEELVNRFLRLIDQRVEKVAFRGFRPRVKLKSETGSVPLSSFGEGMGRILEIGTNLATAAGGVLLIDEIDTGLYYRRMPEVWKLVIEAARRLDVQVFATTHSFDCIRALGLLGYHGFDAGQDVLVHRIDPGATGPVTYDISEIEFNVEESVEVR